MSTVGVLLVEDDHALGAAVRDALVAAGYAVTWVRDGDEAARAWDAQSGYALLVLDLGLPGRDGLDVLREGRARELNTPVLVLTARDEPQDRVLGLDAGADDYLAKPFHLAELLARVRARLRRDTTTGAETATTATDVPNAGLQLMDDPRGVSFQGREVALTASEFDLLECLARSAGRVVPRDRLEGVLARSARTPGSNTLDVYIHRLRRKLHGRLIRTVHGIGYVLEADFDAAEHEP